VIVAFKTSYNNQCTWNWFYTQAFTTENKTSIIIWHMCQIQGGGTWPTIFTLICWL
jgi:hypothetical protein